MDKKIAFELHLKSANKCFAPAQYMMGVYYEKSYNLVTVDHHKAVYWYQLAANQEDKRAHNNLALFYKSGLGGLDINIDMFLYHIKMSAKLGYTLGMCNLGLYYQEKSKTQSSILERLRLAPKNFALATCHRAENTDDPSRLRDILAALAEISTHCKVVLPLHPRTKKMIESLGYNDYLLSLVVVDPLPFLDMVALEQAAKKGQVAQAGNFVGVAREVVL
jgi:hypothetical protein